ncbi:hypothetical protein [Desulfovibrio sp.]|uniref:hypothetical protein n=1 Tax=Desulfovibrio sp. TaxID=885 RepID=UPI003D14328B
MIISEEERMYLTRDLWECLSPAQPEVYPAGKMRQQLKHKHAPPPRRRSAKQRTRTIIQQDNEKYSQKTKSGHPSISVPPASRGVVFIMAISAGVAGFMLAGFFVCLLFAGLIVI